MNINLPNDFTNRMRTQLGADIEAFMKCYDLPAHKSLRMNTRRISPVDCARMSKVFTGSETPENVQHCPFSYYYDDATPGRSAYHEAGAYYIQEASAMLPVTMLGADDSGLRILDLCAAPGGKSTQIADLMNGYGLLVSNEIIPSRAAVLSGNIERMGVENALVTSEDPVKLSGHFPAFFDRILVDAPCSGEGMFRKNPEAVSEWSLENVEMCAKRQDMLLDCAVLMLSKGGRIVYSTCTFSPEEDEGAVERFLERHPEFSVCDGPVKMYPHTCRGEGHFAVAFACSEDSEARRPEADGRRDATKRVPQTRIGEDCLNLLVSFLEETLADDSDFLRKVKGSPERLMKFGDSISFVPEQMPDISGLKVLRAGIKLGTFKKNRFEPDHALSHCLTKEDVRYCIDLDADSNEIRQYISGMTINCDKEMKGWCLVFAGGFGLGWGKASQGVLKNHYPKGLRIQ